MTYDEIRMHGEKLNYRDKLRLAQLLIQLACKEEEAQNPAKRTKSTPVEPPDDELIQYVAMRLQKLRPSKKETVLNSIGAMFQFRGGVSDSEKEIIFSALLEKQHLAITDNRVRYPERK